MLTYYTYPTYSVLGPASTPDLGVLGSFTYSNLPVQATTLNAR